MADDPFSVSMEGFVGDLNINVVGVFAALKYAITAFQELPKEEPKTFIFTGNGLTDFNNPKVMTLGLGKRAALFLIENAVATHGSEGIRFVDSFFLFISELVRIEQLMAILFVDSTMRMRERKMPSLSMETLMVLLMESFILTLWGVKSRALFRRLL